MSVIPACTMLTISQAANQVTTGERSEQHLHDRTGEEVEDEDCCLDHFAYIPFEDTPLLDSNLATACIATRERKIPGVGKIANISMIHAEHTECT